MAKQSSADSQIEEQFAAEDLEGELRDRVFLQHNRPGNKLRSIRRTGSIWRNHNR